MRSKMLDASPGIFLKSLQVDLLPPFAYLNDLSEKVSGCSGSASEDTAESQTSGDHAGCSNESLAF